VRFLLFIAALGCACAEEKVPVPENLPPDLTLERVRVRQFKGSATQAIMQTQTLGFHREGPLAGQVVAQTVTLDALSSGLHVEVDRVSGDALAGMLHGEAVHAVTSSGIVIDTPQADFDRGAGPSGTASSDAGIVVTHPQVRVEAESGWFELDSEHAEFSELRTTVHGH
jgi:hypothetical protein